MSALSARARSAPTTSPASRARARCTSSSTATRSREVQAADLRAAALLRGVAARPRVHRGARHHRADLRHLPDRLPDERRAGDGGRLRRRDRRRADPRPAPADLLRRVDREPRLHVYMLHAPDFLGYPGVDRDGPRPPRDRRAGAAAEEGRQRARWRSSADARSIRSTCASAASTARRPRRELRGARRAARARPARSRSTTVALGRATLDFPDVEREPELVALRDPERYPIDLGRIVSDRGLDIAAGRVRRARRRGARRALERAARPPARARQPT